MEETNKVEVLMKSNTLIKSRYNLTLMECRVFMYILYRLQKTKDGKMFCTIKNEDFGRLSDNRNIGFVKGIKTTLDSILDKHIYFEEYMHDGKVGDWGKYNLINGYTYVKDSNSFEIEVSQKVFDLLISYLDSGYTPVNLNVWLSLKSISGQRLYELLRLWSGSKKSIEYTVDDIKSYMMLEDKYKEYSNFKRRIISPGVKELNETGLFNIDIKENKVGRRVNSITFDVEDMDKRKYFDEVKELVPKVIEDISSSNKDIEIANAIKMNKDVYVPDESVFTKGTLRRFKLDFEDINFTNEYMRKAFEDSVMIVLDRDDVETIKAPSYKFFKGTLDNKIIEYKKEEEGDRAHQVEMDLFW